MKGFAGDTLVAFVMGHTNERGILILTDTLVFFRAMQVVNVQLGLNMHTKHTHTLSLSLLCVRVWVKQWPLQSFFKEVLKMILCLMMIFFFFCLYLYLHTHFIFKSKAFWFIVSHIMCKLIIYRGTNGPLLCLFDGTCALLQQDYAYLFAVLRILSDFKS